MNYNELKDIIKHLKKIVPCSNCSKRFNNDNINVLSSFNNEALFHFDCNFCTNQLIVHVSVTDQGEQNSQLNIHAKNTKTVSQNEVLDIHNFLNDFKGDFKQLFKTIN
jgi:hypothetical protein